MARCLRCHAGNEWIEGAVMPEPRMAEALHTCSVGAALGAERLLDAERAAHAETRRERDGALASGQAWATLAAQLEDHAVRAEAALAALERIEQLTNDPTDPWPALIEAHEIAEAVFAAWPRTP